MTLDEELDQQLGIKVRASCEAVGTAILRVRDDPDLLKRGDYREVRGLVVEGSYDEGLLVANIQDQLRKASEIRDPEKRLVGRMDLLVWPDIAEFRVQYSPLSGSDFIAFLEEIGFERMSDARQGGVQGANFEVAKGIVGATVNALLISSFFQGDMVLVKYETRNLPGTTSVYGLLPVAGVDGELEVVPFDQRLAVSQGILATDGTPEAASTNQQYVSWAYHHGPTRDDVEWTVNFHLKSEGVLVREYDPGIEGITPVALIQAGRYGKTVHVRDNQVGRANLTSVPLSQRIVAARQLIEFRQMENIEPMFEALGKSPQMMVYRS